MKQKEKKRWLKINIKSIIYNILYMNNTDINIFIHTITAIHCFTFKTLFKKYFEKMALKTMTPA